MRKQLTAGDTELVGKEQVRDLLIFWHCNYGLERSGFTQEQKAGGMVTVTFIKTYQLIDKTTQPDTSNLNKASW